MRKTDRKVARFGGALWLALVEGGWHTVALVPGRGLYAGSLFAVLKKREAK